MFQRTTAIQKIQAIDEPIKVIQGSTGAGKTVGILSILIDKAQQKNQGTISVISESMPHLRRGAIKDFLSIMQQHHYFKDERWNKTNLFYTFETGTIMEFFSADTPDKVHGPRRNILFINEANHISYDIYTQLELRTEGDIYIDFNPTQSFWAHTELKNSKIIIITYKDNEGYPESSRIRLEAHKDNKAFWRVYGLGLIGELEESIYKDWKIIDEIPHEAVLERRWLDFGYSVDPTAIGDVYKYNDGYILDEHTYLIGLRNKQIADILLNLPPTLVIADSSEPKSIDEIALYGINIQGAKKGPDSVRNGIQLVQSQRISVTKRSVNIIKEYRNYVLSRDRNGNLTNNPIDLFNHCFVGNTNIKTISGDKNIKDIMVGDIVLTTKGYKKVLLRHNNGIKPVNKYRLQLDTRGDILLSCTPTHKIKTNKGWTQISELKSGMIITLTKSLMEKSTTCIHVQNTSQEVQTQCTQKYGKNIMVRYLRDLIYTTKMATLGITELRTLKSLLKVYIHQTTPKDALKKIQNYSENGKRKVFCVQNYGMRQKKEQNGTQFTANNFGSKGNQEPSPAKSVVKNIKHDTREFQNTVIKTAKLRRCVKEESWKEEVYDLTVEGVHEYFANDICVHNCMDGIRYCFQSMLGNAGSEIYKKQADMFTRNERLALNDNR